MEWAHKKQASHNAVQNWSAKTLEPGNLPPPTGPSKRGALH